MPLVPPVTYQGGKQRIADEILNLIHPTPHVPFHDLCCGSGAVSVKLVDRGFNPTDITMVDSGPWGLVWALVGSGGFDLSRFKELCDEVPADRQAVQAFLKELSGQDATIDTPYVFLLLQAGSFGGKAIWTTENPAGGAVWKNTTFRKFWQPTATSSRRSPVNPMMPMKETLLARMGQICRRMRGVRGRHLDVCDYRPLAGVAYLDPPYKGTTHYGHSFDVATYCSGVSVPIWVSEGRPLTASATRVAAGRRKGGISGLRARDPAEEWLSFFPGVNNDQRCAACY